VRYARIIWVHTYDCGAGIYDEDRHRDNVNDDSNAGAKSEKEHKPGKIRMLDFLDECLVEVCNG
jgi:hypothetical protein